MLNKLSVYVTPLILLALLNGCSPDFVFKDLAESQMTPESLGISAANYRGYDCPMLNATVESFEKERLKAENKRPWQWHIDAMNQIRTEKNCAGNSGTQTKGSASTLQSTNKSSANNPMPTKGVIGVYMVDLTPAVAESMGMKATSGVAVVEAVKGLSAAKAGIKAKDIITEVAGQSVSTQQQVQDIIGNMKLGYMADIQILRNKTRKVYKVKVISGDKAPKNKVSDQAPISKPNTTVPSNTKPTTSTGPIVYSYCRYYSAVNEKGWTSKVFSLIQTPSVDQTGPWAEEFRVSLDSRYHLGGREPLDTWCQLFDTEAQAIKALDKDRDLFNLDIVDWKPAN